MEILKKAESLSNKEIKDTIRLSLEEEFLFNEKQLNFILKEKDFDYVLLTNNSICFINKENEMKSLKITKDYDYEKISSYLTKNNLLENLSSNYFRIK